MNEEDWPESRRQYRKDFQEIRRDTVALRKKLLAAALENCDPQMVYAAVRLENVAAAREHAKSTFFTFGLPVHDISYNLRHFILIVTDSNDQATGFTLPIRLEFEESPRLLHDFGNLRGRKWNRAIALKSIYY